MTMMEPEPGETFPPLSETSRLDGEVPAKKTIGAYTIERVLGAGGMGKVYLGIDESLDRKAAIKVIAEHLAPSEEIKKRLNTEARAAARLNHPNIVQVYAFGREERNGLTYIAFEYVDGRDVDDYLKNVGKLELTKALNLVKQAAQGLRFAYSQQIIHRDIKPANLMMLKDGTIKIADFGLAKELDKDHMKTSMNAIIGSPAFMSPEQGQGRTLDFRSDVYSLGATLFCCLTGSIPFKGESAISVLLMHANDPLPEPMEISKHLDGGVMALLKKMMAKKPEDRHQSYDELIAEIDALLDGTSVRKAAASRHIPKGKKNPTWLIALGLAGIIGTLGIIFTVIKNSSSRKSALVSAAEFNQQKPNLSDLYKPENTDAVDAKPKLENVASLIAPQNTFNSTNSVIDIFAEKDFPPSLTSKYAQMTKSERDTLQELSKTMYVTQRVLFDGMRNILPLELVLSENENMNVTIMDVDKNSTSVLVKGNLMRFPGPAELPNEIKIKIAQFADSTTPPLPKEVRNQFNFYRYILFDSTIKRQDILAEAPTPETAQQLDAMMNMRDLYQIIARTPPPNPNGQANQLAPQQRPNSTPRHLGNRLRERINPTQ